MKSLLLPLGLIASLLASACVTINVYFPAAAAQAAADRVIDEVWGESAAPASSDAEPVSRSAPPSRPLAATLLDWILPAAHAADPDLDVSSPAIKELTANMEARFPSLSPYLDSGVIGIGKDGFVALRDANAVPLAKRNAVRKLVANENADRKQLYREIAQANGQPQWEEQIRQVFAQRWIVRARPGWQVETEAGWASK